MHFTLTCQRSTESYHRCSISKYEIFYWWEGPTPPVLINKYLNLSPKDQAKISLWSSVTYLIFQSWKGFKNPTRYYILTYHICTNWGCISDILRLFSCVIVFVVFCCCYCCLVLLPLFCVVVIILCCVVIVCVQ